jgi:hypothetical protein
MQGQFGKVAPGQMIDTKILNNQGIWTDLIQSSQGLDKLSPLPLLYQGIESNIELAAALTADLDQRGHFSQAKVGSVSPGAKGFETNVDCIGAVIQGSKKCFDTAGRSQEFELSGSRIEF